MRGRVRVAVATVAAVVLVLAVAGGVWWWRERSRTDLQRAVAVAPHDAERLSWTDWAGVRRELGVSLSASSSTGALDRFLDRGYEADLTSTSALLGSADDLQQRFGVSPADVDWELFSQSSRGAVVILRLPDDFDFDALGDRLSGLGFTRPSSDTGVWRGGEALLGQLGGELTPELQYFALDADRHLVLTSDTGDYLGDAVADVDGGDQPAQELREVADASGEPLSASVYDGDYTCSALAMSQADKADQDTADRLLQEAGEVNPITAFAMSVQADRDVRVVMSFETDDQARTNADTRRALASGPAPGQGGDFSDRFSVSSVTADGRLVTMALHPRRGAYVLSDLSSGPVLFATC